jgi:hypothetical protein
MSNVESMNNQKVKSYLGFEEGSYAARKGRLCLIKKIHFEMHPPAVTVQMMDTDTEVGTEFDRLQHVSSWFCDMCTAQNTEAQAKKCSFCKMDRSYKEKIIVIDPSDTAASSKPSEPVEQAPDINKAEQETTDTDTETNDDDDVEEAAQESKATDDEYEEVPESPVNANDPELSAEDEPVEHEPGSEHECEVKAKSESAPAVYGQHQHGYWPSYQHEAAMHREPVIDRVRPQRHGVEPAVANEHKQGHGQSTQNRSKRQHTDFLPPPPVGQRRTASKRRTRSHPQQQPNGSWMYDDDDDMMQFRRPLHSYWPRSWYDWDW